MSETVQRIYARVVVGEIVVDCEAPIQYASNTEASIKMLMACADKAVEIIKAKEPKP